MERSFTKIRITYGKSHLMYLEAGIVPARYQVMCHMMNFLQCILMQPLNYLLKGIYQAQIRNPKNSD